MASLKRFWKDRRLWVVLIAFGAVGLALILIPALYDWRSDHGVVKEIGIAFLTTAILGGTVHTYLERALAKDAFEGAVGYFLPPDVKEAVRFISGLHWFAEEFSWTVELDRDERHRDLIKATVHIRKKVKNITHSSRPIKSFIHVDEWGHKEKSKIIACEVHTSST